VQELAALRYALAGGEAAFRARPFLTVMVCHVVPPMRFAEEACETLEAAILAGFPVQLISAGQAGATSPATIAGSLVQAVAETLAGLVFGRLVDPDVQAIFAPKPLVADLRTGSMCGGGGEQAILMAAAAQMGRHYDLPTSSIAGITDAKTLDAQFGSEKCLAVTMAAHAGSNLITQSCGMQASLLGVSLEAYVADNDMLGNILRTLRGVEVTPDNIAEDVIANVCRGEGHYLGQAHTFERMKSDYFYPHIGDRRTPRDWESDGSSTIGDRARDVARQLIAEHFPAHLDDARDTQLRAAFDIRLPRQAMSKSS
jgi:trimethylamine--corrinoid protein Co-methyltransferase